MTYPRPRLIPVERGAGCPVRNALVKRAWRDAQHANPARKNQTRQHRLRSDGLVDFLRWHSRLVPVELFGGFSHSSSLCLRFAASACRAPN